jgi:hypothetical protein
MNYERLEKELKKRTKLTYSWRRKQLNKFDKQTNFIYKIDSFNSLLTKIEKNFKSNSEYTDLKTTH